MTRTIFFHMAFRNFRKKLRINQLLVSAPFFTNIFLLSMCSDLFLITAKKVKEIRNNVVCVAARLVFAFCCALATGRCNAFQYVFVNQKKIGVLRPIFRDLFQRRYFEILYLANMLNFEKSGTKQKLR